LPLRTQPPEAAHDPDAGQHADGRPEKDYDIELICRDTSKEDYFRGKRLFGESEGASDPPLDIARRDPNGGPVVSAMEIRRGNS